MSLISKIQSLISSANAVTGESRTDLTSAVQDLKDGYGGGGGTEKATMIQLPPSHFMSGQSMFMNGSGMTSWYCDFGKPITISAVKTVKTATSNRFRVGFFTTDPSTATGTSLSGLECYNSSGDGVSPAGTSKDMYVSSSYNPRYMVVTLSNENTTTPAPDTWFVELQTN